MFTIIIPTLNEEQFLPKLLKSLSLQTEKDFEVIIVDGKSKDKTVEVAKSFQSELPRLQVITSPRASLPYQRNYGAKIAKGNWLLFVDADSQLYPYCLERCRMYLSGASARFFTTWFSPDSDVGSDANLILVSNIFVEAARILKRQLAPGPFAAITREAFELVGGYNENCQFGEDQDLSMRLYEKGVELSIIRETLYVYSLRRFRKQGTLKMLQTYAKGSMATLLTRRAPKYMPGYIMGGHFYEKSRTARQKSRLRELNQKLKSLLREFLR